MLEKGFVERLALIMTALAGIAAWAVGSRALASGIATGGGLAVANFWALRRVVAALFCATRSKAFWGTLFAVKLCVMGAAFFLALRYLPIDHFGVILGVSVVPIATLVCAFRVAARANTETSQSRAKNHG